MVFLKGFGVIVDEKKVLNYKCIAKIFGLRSYNCVLRWFECV